MNRPDTLSGDPPDKRREFDFPAEDPVGLLRDWVEEATDDGVREPSAACLATVGPNGRPSVRVILLKDVTEAGLVFTTSAESRKGLEISKNPHVALNLYWRETLQQVSVQGRVKRLSDSASDALFDERPRAAKAAVLVSHQSGPLGDEGSLRREAEQLERSDVKLRRPADWFGWLVEPVEIEFWQGSRDRLHRRLRYRREGNCWSVQRLQP